MAVSNTNIQTYLNNWDTVYQPQKQSLATNNLSDLDTAEAHFLEKNFTVQRISIVEVKLVYGWHTMRHREELFNKCLNAGFLLVEHFEELNSTFQDFFTVLFKYRQKAGTLCIIQWNGQNPSVTRPLQELIIAT